ncbi:MAG: hypothetical protein AAGF60_16195 [Pseudomonadota bacterium]
MASVSFTMRVDEALKSALETEAQRANVSASQLAVQAIQAHLDAQAAERHAIDAALEAADAGKLISQDDMMAWIASWDTDDERPIPRAE